jgi:hypothetical protein
MMSDDQKQRFKALKALGHSKMALYYINDHVHMVPRFTIDSVRGSRVAWTARTTLRKMTETRNYLEKAYQEACRRQTRLDAVKPTPE